VAASRRIASASSSAIVSRIGRIARVIDRLSRFFAKNGDSPGFS
jgi:hypothetical protein